MGNRAQPSGHTLTERDASVVKGMLARGDRQHDIAAFFGVNPGRIAEVANGSRFGSSPVAKASELPPVGPYPPPGELLQALNEAKRRISELEIAKV